MDKVIASLHKRKEFILGLVMYIDFHAHPSKRSCFLFGNNHDLKNALESRLFAQLLTLNCEDFDLASCDFSESNMIKADKADGQSKVGSGRVALFKKYKIFHCYTLENNFLIGK